MYMPWFLKFESKKTLFSLLLGIGLAGTVVVDLVLGSTCVTPIYLLIMAFLVFNEWFYRRYKRQLTVFSPASKVRNVNYLVIGELCDAGKYVPEGKSYIAILAPGRSLKSAYETARHTFSILDENDGAIVFSLDRKNMQGGYSLFDYPVFRLSPISLKRLNLEKNGIIEHLLFACHPIRSIKYLLQIRGTYEKPLATIPKEIEEFCNERNISIKIYTN